MSIRIGMPSVGRLCLAASGLFLSRPPGVFSQATTPHILPLHCATRMLATPWAPRQSPVGSAASAEPALAARSSAEQAVARAIDLGQCNMVQTYACGAGRKSWLKRGQNAAFGVFS